MRTLLLFGWNLWLRLRAGVGAASIGIASGFPTWMAKQYPGDASMQCATAIVSAAHRAIFKHIEDWQTVIWIANRTMHLTAPSNSIPLALSRVWLNPEKYLEKYLEMEAAA